MVNVSYILYTLSSPTAWDFNNLSPQGVVITLCVCGIVSLCSMVLRLSGEVKRARLRAPTINPVKHMNLLGLVSVGCPCFAMPSFERRYLQIISLRTIVQWEVTQS